ncbi:TolC family protein [Silvanigrella aquatica]|uniref:Transporter n=1 Tax=Silvanigrella aquatica TaxID=1915309 RepID=A0A1L4CX85_9BACT|nr:TolC family protein [Silvanigrella aquatica]APJ02563.1 hypothetical protein AXG55_00885 [Silvanigrella aquatica]
MYFKTIFYCTILPFFLNPIDIFAQEIIKENNTLTLSLQSTMELAEDNSTEVKSANIELNYNDNLHTLSYFNFGPNISANANAEWFPQNIQNFNTGQSNQASSAGLKVEQPITGIWQSFYKIQQYSAQYDAATFQAEDSKIKARTDGAQAFIKAQQAFQDMEIKRNDLENAQKQWNDTKILFESGDESKTKIDVLQMQAKFTNSEVEFEMAQNLFQNRVSELKNLLKLNSDVSIQFQSHSQSQWETYQNKMPELNILVSENEKNRSDLKIIDKKIISQDNFIKQTNFEYFPKIDAFAAYQRNNSLESIDINAPEPSNSLNFGLKLSWSIWDGGLSTEKRMSQINEREKLKLNKTKKEFDIRNEISQAYYNLNSNIQILPKSKLATEALEEAYKLSQIKYKTGNLTASELIQVQNSYISAKISLSKLRGDIDFSWIQLQAAIGQLPNANTTG